MTLGNSPQVSSIDCYRGFEINHWNDDTDNLCALLPQRLGIIPWFQPYAWFLVSCLIRRCLRSTAKQRKCRGSFSAPRITFQEISCIEAAYRVGARFFSMIPQCAILPCSRPTAKIHMWYQLKPLGEFFILSRTLLATLVASPGIKV